MVRVLTQRRWTMGGRESSLGCEASRGAGLALTHELHAPIATRWRGGAGRSGAEEESRVVHGVDAFHPGDATLGVVVAVLRA